jgi:hypothetical protein
LKFFEKGQRLAAGQDVSEYDEAADDDEEDGEPLGLAQLEDGKATCLACGRTFSSIYSGKRHYATAHQSMPRSTCKICKKTAKNDLAMKKHLKRFHGITETMWNRRILPDGSFLPPLAPTPLSLPEIVEYDNFNS